MTPEQLQLIIDQLIDIGTVLGTKVFELALRQVYLNAWLNLGFLIVLTILLASLSTILIRDSKIRKILDQWEIDHQHDDWSKKPIKPKLRLLNEDLVPWIWFGVVLDLISMAYVVQLIVSYLYNPEWYAISFLLDKLY